VIVVSPILKRVVYPALANSGYLRRRAHGGAFCTLTYHGVLPAGYEITDPQHDGCLVTAENFRSQLRLLKEIYNVVSPGDVREWIVGGKELPERAILLTCDDGLCNALTEMAPILVDEGLTCLFFVLGLSASGEPGSLWYEDLYSLMVAAPAGGYWFESLALTVELADQAKRQAVWWDLVKRLSAYDREFRESFVEAARSQFGLSDSWRERSFKDEAQWRRFGILNLEQLRQLVAMGMEVGSHTMIHPVLSQLPSELAWQEIAESRTLLQKALGKPMWALAYPYGDAEAVTAREMQMAEQAGYECAFMNVGGGFGAALPRFGLPRVHVSMEMNLAEFEAHVSGFHRDFRAKLAE
jgi:peptidoglycan/xylan/chitin deacetylase (PgdA/CDA1 family)